MCSNVASLSTFAETVEESTSADTTISSDESSTDDIPYEPDPEPEPEPEPQPDPEPEPEPQPDPEPIIPETSPEVTTTPEIQTAAFMYTVNNNEAVLVSCKTPALDVIDVPEFIDGYPVTTIAEDVFSQCYNAVEINIPYSVKTISEGAFRMCTNLEHIGVATENTHYKSSDGVLYSFDGVSIIAYPSNKSGDTYTIAESVKYMGTACFNNCVNLESIVLPSNISVIGYSAFNGCINLKNLTVNNNIQLSQTMFENCNLEKIYGYENSQAEEFASMYGIEFESIGVLETSQATTETTVEETTITTVDTTPVDTTTSEAESIVYYAPERESMDKTQKIVIVIIVVAMISLVVAVASKSRKRDDDDDDDDEDDIDDDIDDDDDDDDNIDIDE